MHDDHEQSARPEQPREGGFEEGQQTQPGSERVGSFGDGNAEQENVGQFSDGNEALPDDTREGKFSDSVDTDER